MEDSREVLRRVRFCSDDMELSGYGPRQSPGATQMTGN